MKRILFVCTSNICRSFLAEYIFKDMLEKADEEGKLNKKDFRISSAGLFAIEDDEAGSPAVKVLEDILYVDNAKWLKETEGIEEFYQKFGDRLPEELKNQLAGLKERLSK